MRSQKSKNFKPGSEADRQAVLPEFLLSKVQHERAEAQGRALSVARGLQHLKYPQELGQVSVIIHRY